MAEEFQGGICGGNWWSSSRSLFMAASPCSVGLNHDVAGFGWLHNDMVDIKGARSSSGDTNSICDSTSNNNNLNSGFHEVHKPHHHQNHDHNINGTGVLIDSSLQMMGFGVSNSPTSSDLNVQANDFLKRAENNNIYSVLQEDNMGTKLNYREEIGLLDSPLQIQKEFSGGTTTVTTTSEAALSAGFPVSSASYNNGYGSSAMLLQSLFDGGSGEANHQVVPQQQSFSNNNQSMTYNSSLTAANYVSNLGNNNNHNMVSSSWPRFPAPKKQLQQPGGLQFSNNTPFWNASDAAGGLFPSLPPQLQYVTPTSFEEKPKCITKANINNEEVQDSGSVLKKNSTTGIDHHHHQPFLKRARIETPSPLPTFKVRKEKLGDRITALQQLVSPFGKTDTASVLHEAIEYIKFLHDQVSVLSSPYMKNGASIQVQQQCSTKLIKDQESLKQDLRSRGLCLVPISSTFPVANDHTTADFWTPTFGGTFR